IMPGIMGIIADNWLRAERAYMLCHLVCAGALLYATTVTDPQTGISSGAAVALIAMALRHRSNPHSTEARFVHRMETPVVWLEI
ncbi:hypothetical protein MJN54_34340, partial [Salmonella enterica subsp. enterica serovar Kentucky]|nr:hypothetical protein [Salmonella enterica subsp. enterica serovar Kentucky]